METLFGISCRTLSPLSTILSRWFGFCSDIIAEMASGVSFFSSNIFRIRIVWSWDGVQSFRSISSTKSRWQSSSRKEISTAGRIFILPSSTRSSSSGTRLVKRIYLRICSRLSPTSFAKTSFVRCRSKSDTTGVEFSFFWSACLPVHCFQTHFVCERFFRRKYLRPLKIAFHH